MNICMILKNKGATVHTIDGDTRLQSAAQILSELRVGALIVMNDEGEVDGILSERDIIHAVADTGPSALSEPVRRFMTAQIQTCTPDDTLDMVMGLMTNRRIRHLPVLNGGRLMGIVSIGDLVKARIAESEAEADALKQYIVAG